jgi:hypothetical protein
MVREFIRALFLAGIPVALASYALVWWSLRQGYLGPVSSVRDMEKGIKLMSKKRAQDRKQRKVARKSGAAEAPVEAEGMSFHRIDPVHNKWLAFGGGFYGIVGLLTYAVVEVGELIDFFRSFESFAALLAQFGIDMLVDLFVDALMNFVVAIAWPVYWMSEIAMNHVWIWFGVAYLGYWAGVKLAVHRFGQAAGQAAP